MLPGKGKRRPVVQDDENVGEIERFLCRRVVKDVPIEIRPRERHHTQPASSRPAVRAIATRIDMNTNTAIRKSTPRRAESTRWIMGELCTGKLP